MLVLQASCVSAQKTMNQPDKIICVGTLHPLSQTTLEVKKGDIFCYNAAVHGSVGIGVEYYIEDKEIVELHSSKLEYEHEEKVKEHMSGADAATKTFAFQALKSGETNVIIKEVFRGDVRQTHTFKIIVK
jgi:hypothetical protein